MSRPKSRNRQSRKRDIDVPRPGDPTRETTAEDDDVVMETAAPPAPASKQTKWLVGAIVALALVCALLAVLLVRQELSGPATTTATTAGPAVPAGPAGSAVPAGPTVPGAAPTVTAAGPVPSPSGPSGATAGGVPLTTLPGGVGPLGDRARRQPNDPLAQGRVDAPVVMLIYEDYACPFCIKFTLDHEPQLKAKYVDTGKLRFEWRDMPIFGAESEMAAVAGRAAGNQGKFWEYKASIHAGAPPTGKPSLTRDVLLEHARKVGIKDMARFERDMADPNLKALVAADQQSGAQVGFTSTPSFVIHGRPVVGARPLADFEAVIDQSLAAAGRA